MKDNSYTVIHTDIEYYSKLLSHKHRIIEIAPGQYIFDPLNESCLCSNRQQNYASLSQDDVDKKIKNHLKSQH